MAITPIKAAIYARSASIQGHTPPFPTTEQINQAIIYATEKGYQVVDELIFEEVFSGIADHPPLLEEVIANAKEGRFNVLIVNSVDRISRKIYKCDFVIDKLKDYGVTVESVTETLNDEASGSFVASALDFVRDEEAKIQREKISSRTQARRREKRQKQEGQ